MKKIILLIVMIMAISLVGCKNGDTTIEHLENKITLIVYGYDWDKLKNTVEETRENYPEYEITKYLTYSFLNRITIVFEKKGE